MTRLNDDLKLLQSEEWADALHDLTNKSKADVLLQIVWEHIDKEDPRKFKLFALELAETLGPGHCQTLYHLAVLATKLA